MMAPLQYLVLAQSWAMEGSKGGLHLQLRLLGLQVVGTSSSIHMLTLCRTDSWLLSQPAAIPGLLLAILRAYHFPGFLWLLSPDHCGFLITLWAVR